MCNKCILKLSFYIACIFTNIGKTQTDKVSVMKIDVTISFACKRTIHAIKLTLSQKFEKYVPPGEMEKIDAIAL